METLHLYLDTDDINKYIHAKLSPEDVEKYKDTFFFAYQSELNKNDMSIDIHVVACTPEKYDNIKRRKIEIGDFVSTISGEE